MIKVKKTESQIKRYKIKYYLNKELLSDEIDDETKLKRKKQLNDIKQQEKNEKVDAEKKKVNLITCSGRIRRFAKTHKLKANDKESSSVILLMAMLESGGTSISVLKESVF